MSKKKLFVGVQFVETVRVGKRTFAFGIYHDSKVGKVPFAGLAEKNPSDKENAARGRNLAIGRAFETLGKEIEKREWTKLKRSIESKPKDHVLSAKEVSALKNSPEAVAKREARTKVRTNAFKKRAKASVSTDKADTKSRKAGTTA
jgi:hypothetical protein